MIDPRAVIHPRAELDTGVSVAPYAVIGADVTIEILRATEALDTVLHHWYLTRFGLSFLNSIDLRDYFLKATKLAREIPVRRLRRPTTLSDDPVLADAIESAIRRDLESA